MTTLIPKRHFKVETRRPNDGRCNRHPRHEQSPGVCSLCLRQKLSQLNNHNASRRTSTTTGSSNGGSSTTSSVSSYYSSSSTSSCSSPPHRANDNKASSSVLSSFFSRNSRFNVLKKSRSMVLVPISNGRDNSDDMIHAVKSSQRKEEKKKRGFWSKLLRHKRSVVDRESSTIFMQRYSRTMRERSSVHEGL